MKENVILATRTVRLAVEDTADNACPATQVGTVKSMDVYASVQLDECILHTSMKLPAENKRKTVALVVASSILLILTSGAIVFIWKRSRTKLKPVNQGGYEKLVDNTKTATSFKSNHHQSTSYLEDQMIEYKDRDDDDDDDDDDDIVYMGQDGTVYRKFKYGLLEDDAEDELEYDDESYSFR
uniref:Proprotein convertase subtilisin/kexin type 5 n=1 Tax=Sphaerodactylus townsendi TaxID=933632 RepID=A0ACB8EQT3_9SAUR